MIKKVSMIFVLGFLLIISGCGGDEKNGSHGRGDRAQKVRTWTATVSNYTMKVSAVGTLEPEDDVVLSAEVSATVSSILKDEGAEIKKGTTLAVLDRETFELVFDSARADATSGVMSMIEQLPEVFTFIFFVLTMGRIITQTMG